MNKMKIEIWSDIACPYCYVGIHKLEKALALFPHTEDIVLVWHSYELDLDLPKGKSDKSYYQYLASLNEITEDEAKEDFKEVLALAKDEGININPEKIVVTSTRDALRLVSLAHKYNLAAEAEKVLFNAYFSDGDDISDRETLIRLGIKIGISGADVERCLDNFEYSEDIQKDMTRAENDLQLEFIPFYLLNNKYKVQGSILVEEYIDVLNKAYADWKLNGFNPDNESFVDYGAIGKACSIDGTCSL